jgi:acetoin utilization deacetylase AcuC-like enzyme
MKSVYSERHKGHAGNVELVAGAIVPAYELPSRAEFIRARIDEVGLGPVLSPVLQTLEAAKRVHRADFIDFLPDAYPLWKAAGFEGTAMPFTWPTRGLRADKPPKSIEALLGYYSFDAGATFVEGTWDAIRSSYEVALMAAGLIANGERSSFALCRPPGHHAGSSFMGGYCFINNAAVAAQWFRDNGAAKVAILDVDYHHGNGTQEIFYERDDILVINLHGDPATEYPFFLGHADEAGHGKGTGFNINFPMPPGTDFHVWGAALEEGCRKIEAYRPNVVVISLGVDTFEKDPICSFRLKTADYPVIGARIAKLGVPTLFVMEGGYAVAEIAVNAVGVLTGFEG